MNRGRIRARRGVLLLMLAAGGCRAAVNAPGVDGGEDLAVPAGDAAGLDGDLSLAPDLACSAPVGPEICGNGCDDDHNGYVDDDDPACTTQLLVHLAGGSAQLNRLILEPSPHLAVVDNHAAPPNAAGAYHRAFSPAAYLALEGATKTLRRIDLVDGGAAGDFPTAYNVRDACVFNNELIVVERGASSALHRFLADGRTEVGSVSLGAVLATACVSDGNLLYVAVHDAIGSPSQFVVYDQTFTQVGAAANFPSALGASVHCLALAWSRKSGVFYGLFVSDLSPNDPTLAGSQLFPFAFDGSVGAPVDAGVYHAIGDFVP